MGFIEFNQEKCIRCGRCSKVCPMGVIAMSSHGPQVIKEHCFTCGHCVAVCPHAALDHREAPLANQIPLENNPVPDAVTIYRFLRSRRSIRDYQPKSIPREKILQLLDIARFAPTAGNSQGVAYYIIDDPDILRKITTAGIDWIEAQIEETDPSAPYYSEMITVTDNYRQYGKNAVLWNAPCLIVALTNPDNTASARDNAHFSLSYAELYAPALGLGTCWAGVIEAAAGANCEPLLKLLNLPENRCVSGALMVGFPKYRYKRLVDRNPLQITWART
jgi:nitroreductase/NAD-dependent dihydropyrimidine dehydrogenase PreA subunit